MSTKNIMKNIDKIFVVLIVVFTCLACQSISNIPGTYLMKNNAHTFIFNTDSTYSYHCFVFGNHIDKYSSGKWRWTERKTIILNSDVQSNIIPLQVNVESANNIRTITNVELNIFGKDEKEYRCTPQFAIIDDVWYVPGFLPDRGSHSYESSNTINKLFYKISKEPRAFEWIGPYGGRREYYVLETEHKFIASNKGDIINVIVNVPDSLFSYRIFTDTEIKFKGDKLIFKDSEKKTKKMNFT
jgi:hypothetical protein